MSESRAGRRGLTFVELLLATMFFGALMASAGSLVVLCLRAQASARQDQDPHRRLAMALMQIEQDLDGAQRFFGAPFAGSEGHITLARLSPVNVGEGGSRSEWVVIRYLFEPVGDQLALVREERVWRLQEAPSARRVLATLASGRWRFAVLAVDQETQVRALRWQATWPQPLADSTPLPSPLPRIVQFEGVLAGVGADAGEAVSRIFRLPDGTWLTTAL
jgi:hypothetical protein